MYISSARIGNNSVLVWERNNKGRRVEKEFRKGIFYFYIEEKYDDSEYTSMYGAPLRKETFDNYKQYKATIKHYKERGIQTYESDIPPEVKVLSDQYHNSPPPKLNIVLFDIEVDLNEKTGGFAGPESPYGKIVSISMYCNWLNKYIVLAIPPLEVQGQTTPTRTKLHEIEPLDEDIPIVLTYFHNEEDLILQFLEEIEDADIVCGYNSEAYDLPYIGKRIEILLGKDYLDQLSFSGAPSPRWKKTISRFGQEIETLNPYGRIFIDYLVLYKKFEVIERISFKLESIAEEVLPTMRKMSYTGKLSDLYRKDFAYFVRYNIRDTEILKAFEDKLGYIELANMLCHLTNAPWSYIPGTLKMAESALINFCHHDLNKIVIDNPNTGDHQDEEAYGEEEDLESSEQAPNESGQTKRSPGKKGISGALVLDPKVGMHEWIGSIDIASLYPSSIRAINISPETLIGQFKETERAVVEIRAESDTELTLLYEATGEEKTAPANRWKAYLIKNSMSISGYGTVFSQKSQGFIPQVLSSWYSLRKQYQGEKKKYEGEAKAILDKYKSL